jgi:hypothetical protein
MEAAGLNDYFHSTQSVEDSQCKSPPQTWDVRGRLDLGNTGWFHIITLQRPSPGNYFFDGLTSYLFPSNKECNGEDQWEHEQLVVAEGRRPPVRKVRFQIQKQSLSTYSASGIQYSISVAHTGNELLL